MDWRAKVELFEQIRREYEFGIGTIAGVAKKLGVHRRMVREAIGSALPKPRKKTGAAALEAGGGGRVRRSRFWKPTGKRRASSGTRRTASGSGCRASCRSARSRSGRFGEYVHDRKIALGLLVRETFVPQSYDWGVEAQVDWYEAYADLAGERTKLQVFAMRSMASGAAFHCAYLHATQQAFLEAHELAFAYFGGVFRQAALRQPHARR